MASSFAEAPASLQSHLSEPRNTQPSAGNGTQHTPSCGTDPFTLSHRRDEAVSPPVEHIETPAGSIATLSHYQSSDFSDLDDDPFFGADFNAIDPATPSFLDEVAWDQTTSFADHPTISESRHGSVDGSPYPLTPKHTASVHTTPPTSDRKDLGIVVTSETIPDSISPQQLRRPLKPNPILVGSSALTPSHSGSNRTSEDGLAPAPAAMYPQSPRVTISVWDKDDDAPIHTVERTLEDSPGTVRGGIHFAGDLISTVHAQGFITGHRDSLDRWQQESGSRRAGLDPSSRPPDEIPSINEIVSQRRSDERNREVGRWLSDNPDNMSAPMEKSADELRAIDRKTHQDDDIPFGHHTQNQFKEGTTILGGSGGEMSDVDRKILLAGRNFGDAPILHEIQMGEPGRFQPESSQAAIAKFESMCRDNDSIISRSATWGTRRRSFPSVVDVEGVTSGNFLKKLSISRGNGEKTSRPGSFLRDLRGLVRRTSANQLRKRSRSRSDGRSGSQAETPSHDGTGQHIKCETTPHLSPPLGSAGSGKKQTPSINTTLASMGQNFASIWTGHARSGSVSGPSPMGSPRASLNSLSVKNSLRRPRSKSEIPKSTGGTPDMESTSSLVDMWRKSGGPPVAPVRRVNQVPAVDDDDDDDDDELCEDNDMKANPNLIDEITPNLAGFQQHVITLNPALGDTHGYLVERIAHQQVARYKSLLNAKVKHLGLGANCPCGSLCVTLGGTANLLDQKGDIKAPDSLSAGIAEEGMPTEGTINKESFPQDIPMPPTQYLPAEFECRLCYQSKKFQKPSDWTKHVHEDVQPFTCTWDKCRDPKSFKRKADWVRHENEGHRHLEWWTCDVDDCRHTCYRRDNFLQHLVREHKFLEPKVKTKAAMKRAGGVDPTWHKVEQCHMETTGRPQDEPCRFCGKSFPSWKKLTVHLAKHMEQISLPVLRLVDAKAKELAADTIISPIQDPAPRQAIPVTITQAATPSQFPGGQQMPQQSAQKQPRHSYSHQNLGFQSPSSYMYPVMPAGQFHQQQLYPPQFEDIGPSLQSNMGVGQMNQGYNTGHRLQGMQGNQSGSYLPSNNNFMTMSDNDVEPFPQLSMNALGLQSVGDVQLGGQFGGQITFDTMMDPSSVNGSPFSGHESLSTYSHSPHMNASAYNQDQRHNQQQQQGQQQQGQQPQQHWDERPLFL